MGGGFCQLGREKRKSDFVTMDNARGFGKVSPRSKVLAMLKYNGQLVCILSE